MSARQLNRLAKAKGLDPLLGGALNAEFERSEEDEESEDEDSPTPRQAVCAISQVPSSVTDRSKRPGRWS